MIEPVHRFPISVPRYAFSPRNVARAGDLWRCFQESAFVSIAHAGWPTDRFLAMGTAFVVRSMRVVHHREMTDGDRTEASTWLSRFRRQMLPTREIRLESANESIASATQEWVHVHMERGAVRADAEMLASFPTHEGGPSVVLPEYTKEAGPTHIFRFSCWHVWMDPIGHVNHPVYVDFCDEATSRLMVSRGLNPVELTPVAEELRFRNGIVAGDEVTVESNVLGRTEFGQVVIAHRISKGDGVLCADGVTIRALRADASDALFEALTNG